MRTEAAETLPPSLTGTPSRPRVSWGCLIAGITGVATLGLFLAGGLTFWAWRASQEQVVEAELARLRAEGRPTTLAELDGSYRLDPDRPDATPAWQAVVDEVLATGFHRELRSRDLGGLLPRPRDALVALPDGDRAAILTGYVGIGRRLDEACRAGSNVRWPIDYTVGVHDVALRYDEPIVAAQIYLGLRFTDALARGDVAAALTAVEQSLTLADVHATEPDFGGVQLRQQAIIDAMDMTEEMLGEHDLTDAQLDGLGRRLGSIDFVPQLVQVLDGERATWLAEVAEGGPFLGSPSPDAVGPYRRLVAAYDRRLIVEFFRENEKALAAADPSDRDIGLHVVRQVTEARAIALDNPYIPPVVGWRPITAVAAGSRHTLGIETRLRLTRTAIAAVRFRDRTGRWPTSLTELAADLPADALADPHGRLPLRSTTVEAVRALPAGPSTGDTSETTSDPTAAWPKRGLIIYSVGPDGVDDGGRPFSPTDSTDDVILVLPDRPTGPTP